MSIRSLLLLSVLSLSILSGRVGNAAEDTSVAPPKPQGWSFQSARQIPVQAGGRIKPLDSYARELVLFQTGSRSFQGWDPIDMLLSQIAEPEAWNKYPFIQVSREDVRRQLGIDEKRSRFTPHELMTNHVLAQYAMSANAQEQQLSAPIANKPKADPREQEFKRVFERLGMFRRIVAGEAWTIVPAEKNWQSLAEMDQAGEPIRKEVVTMLRSYQAGDEKTFERASSQAKAVIESRIPQWTKTDHTRMEVETQYNLKRPFLAAWILYIFAALTWVVARVVTGGQKPTTASGRLWTRVALGVTALAAVIQIAGVVMRCYVAGRPPVTNMYESIIWVSLGQMFFAAILYAIHRQGILFIISSVLATIGLIAADAAPAMMDPGLHPLVPVLRSNYWLTVHVLTITLGYAAFALTLGLANVSLFHFLRSDRPGTSVKIASMNQLTYRAMQFGVVLLAAGTILGGIWADYSWGRFWGWDPKEVWALIALLCYVALLHGRFAGWVRQFGFAVWSVVSFLSVIMAWYGVNFVLGVGLHSYGFSSGGFAGVGTFVALQLAYVGVVALVYKRREGAGKSSPPGAAAQPATP